eukprot:scaffold316_cov352-Pavlova_lutheri.AAC.42
MANEPSVRARQLQLDVRAIAITASDRTRREALNGDGDREQEILRDGDGGQTDIVDGLLESTYM